MIYQIDAATMSMLEEVLNMAQRTVDCQYDLEIEMADSMQLVLAEVAERFDIVSQQVTATGQVIPIKGPPTLTVVD